MRTITSASIVVALIATVAARGVDAQAVSSSDSLARATSPMTTPPATPGSKRNILPAVEITGFLTLLSVYDRIVYADQMQDGKKVYSSTLTTTWDHLRKQTWVHDQDPFNTNQFQHPYQGATMYGLARSTGHLFWTSLAYANAGSFLWKMAGETDPPSIDDMITTGQAGSLLGEALYRMADLVIRDGHGGKARFIHRAGAAIISPPGAINRGIMGDRFNARLPDSVPATSWQIRLGASRDAIAHDYSTTVANLRQAATAEFSMVYGLPGVPGYEYTHPLDYFDFRFSLLFNANNPVENVAVRGLLLGRKTSDHASSRGIWGLYGSYDYFSPYLFRVSSTALSLGTTHQFSIAPKVAVQGSLLGGVGYGAAGSTTVIPSTPTNEAIRDYHYGATPQALAALRVIGDDRVMFDMTAREYHVSGFGSDDTHGSETIFRGDFGLTVRVIGSHALGVQYVASTRSAQYGKQDNKKFSEGAVTFTYSVLGANRFGAVKWK